MKLTSGFGVLAVSGSILIGVAGCYDTNRATRPGSGSGEGATTSGTGVNASPTTTGGYGTPAAGAASGSSSPPGTGTGPPSPATPGSATEPGSSTR